MTGKKHYIVPYPYKLDNLEGVNQSREVSVYPVNGNHFLFYIARAFTEAIKIIKDRDTNIIIAREPFISGLVGFFLAKYYRIGLYVNYTCNFIDDPFWIGRKKIFRVLNWVGKMVLRSADTIRVNSYEEHEKLVKMGIEKDKIRYIEKISEIHAPSLIDIWLAYYDDPNEVNNRGLPKGEFLNPLLAKFDGIVLILGNLSGDNDVITHFNAIRQVVYRYPRTLFLLACLPNYCERLKKLAIDLGVREHIYFLEAQRSSVVRPYYSLVKFIILPGLSSSVTITRSIVAAMSMGLPVLAHYGSGVEDLLKDGKAGFLIPIGDAESLAGKICYLLGNDKIAHTMGQKGAAKVQHLYIFHI